MSLLTWRHIRYPLIILYIGTDMEPAKDGSQSTTRAMQMLDSLSEPVFMLVDSRVNRSDFDAMLRDHQSEIRQMQVFTHHNIRETLVIADESFVKKMTPLLTEQRIRIFKSLEAAYRYVEAHQ